MTRYADVSALVDGQSNSASSVTTPLNQLDAALVALADGNTGFTQINMGTASELTIADGTVTITGSHHTLDTEADAAADVLHTIYGGSAGDVLYLHLADASRTVTLEHGTGNLYLSGVGDHDLTDANRTLKLFHNGTDWTDCSGARSNSVVETILDWTELASAAASVSISSIPSDYKALILRVAARSADTGGDTDDLLVLFNDDTTATNYQGTLEQLHSSAVATSTNNKSFAGLYGGQIPTTTASSGYMGATEIILHNVAASRFKSLLFNGHVIYGATPDMAAVIGGGMWLNAADRITKLTLQTASGENLAAATAYALYGVR